MENITPSANIILCDQNKQKCKCIQTCFGKTCVSKLTVCYERGKQAGELCKRTERKKNVERMGGGSG